MIDSSIETVVAFATAVPCQRHVLRKVKTEEEGESMDERERKELQSFNSVHFQLTRVLSVIRASVIMHLDSENLGDFRFHIPLII